MKRILLVGISATLFCAASAVAASQQSSAAPASSSASAMSSSPATAADKTMPSYDMKAQAALDLQQLQDKYVALAQAIPAEKYTWRPAEGVRSISELFLHVSGASYGFPTMITGVTPAAGFQRDGFEKSTTDKAKIIEQLNKSFSYAIAVVQNMSNADFAKAEKKLGPDANDGDVIYLMVTHAHEHLGQAIADARMNGIVPPWTAEAMKKNPKTAAE
jgi:uncharacterized damage-inducible protein DinB